jgi:hypothetical protein
MKRDIREELKFFAMFLVVAPLVPLFLIASFAEPLFNKELGQ